MPIFLQNYSIGESGTFPHVASNTSGGCYVNGDLYAIRNAARIIYRYNFSQLNQVPIQIDLPSINNGSDTEGMCHLYGTIFCVVTEDGGRYQAHIIDIPYVTENTVLTGANVLATYILAASGADGNSSAEGVCYDPVNNILYVCGEGEEPNTPRRLFQIFLPETHVSMSYENGLDVRDFDAEALFADFGLTGAQFDLSGMTFDDETGNIVICSDRGAMIVELAPDTNPVNTKAPVIISYLAVPLPQMESIMKTDGRNFLAISEPNLWVKIIAPDIPEIVQPANASIAHGETFTYTPSLSKGVNVFWFLEFGPDGMSVDPETGEITFDTSVLIRGQGLTVCIGCSNEVGDDYKWFVLHVDKSGTSKLVELAVDTVSPYIRIAASEAIFAAGDTLAIPAGHYWASVTADGSYENSFADSFGGDMPAGTNEQLTSFIGIGEVIVDAGAHDGIARQDECLELLPDQATLKPYVKWCGIDFTGANRQSIRASAPNNVFELVGATDCGYANAPTTFAEAEAGYASVAAGYVSGAGSVFENSYAFGQFRYGLQFGNPIDNTLMSRCLVRPDDCHSAHPRGGFTHYATSNSGVYSNIVIDGDQEHLSPFYKSYAGAFAFPATGSESYPFNQFFRGNAVINTNMIPFSADGDALTSIIEASDFLVVKATSTITPQEVSRSPIIANSSSVLNLTTSSFSELTTYDGAALGGSLGYFRAGDSVNDIAISKSIFGKLGWNGASNDDLAPLLNVSSGSGGSFTDNNLYNFPGTIDPNGAYTVSGTVTTDPHANGWDYPVRIEEGSPLALAGMGADLQFFKCSSNVMPGDPGWQSPSTRFAWPYPAEMRIAARMKSYSKSELPVRNPIHGQEPVDFDGTISGNRGFCADNESLSEYIWGQFGRTVPPLRVESKLVDATTIKFWIGKPRSWRGSSVTKYNLYSKSDPSTPLKTFVGLSTEIGNVQNGEHVYYITAVDPSKITAFGGNETGESGASREMQYTIANGAGGGKVKLVQDAVGVGDYDQLPLYPIPDAFNRGLLTVILAENTSLDAITGVIIGGVNAIIISNYRAGTIGVLAVYILENDIPNIANNVIAYVGGTPSSGNIVTVSALVEDCDIENFYVNIQGEGFDTNSVDSTQNATFTLKPVKDGLSLAVVGCSKTGTTWNFNSYTQSGTQWTQSNNTAAVAAYKEFSADSVAETETIQSGLATDKVAVFAIMINPKPRVPAVELSDRSEISLSFVSAENISVRTQLSAESSISSGIVQSNPVSTGISLSVIDAIATSVILAQPITTKTLLSNSETVSYSFVTALAYSDEVDLEPVEVISVALVNAAPIVISKRMSSSESYSVGISSSSILNVNTSLSSIEAVSVGFVTSEGIVKKVVLSDSDSIAISEVLVKELKFINSGETVCSNSVSFYYQSIRL